MTGFGQSSFDDGRTQLYIEVKSLNSKFLDLNLRMPKAFADREMEVRNLVGDILERGKITLGVEYETTADVSGQNYNEDLFVSHYTELKKLADRVYAPYDNLFELALNSPNVVKNTLREEVSDDTWSRTKLLLTEALRKCDAFRIDEGKVLQTMLEGCCKNIDENLERIKALDPKRVEKIRDRLRNNVTSFFGDEGFDENRLEQEIIFYVEKLDINEEKVRLKSHLDYFLQALREPNSNGKKLGFISQEIGREINTIGSKSNDADMQRHVVLMKEELEKIKEQLNNVL